MDKLLAHGSTGRARESTIHTARHAAAHFVGEATVAAAHFAGKDAVAAAHFAGKVTVATAYFAGEATGPAAPPLLLQQHKLRIDCCWGSSAPGQIPSSVYPAREAEALARRVCTRVQRMSTSARLTPSRRMHADR